MLSLKIWKADSSNIYNPHCPEIVTVTISIPFSFNSHYCPSNLYLSSLSGAELNMLF